MDSERSKGTAQAVLKGQFFRPFTTVPMVGGAFVWVAEMDGIIFRRDIPPEIAKSRDRHVWANELRQMALMMDGPTDNQLRQSAEQQARLMGQE